MSLVRESLRDKGISERAQEVILQSWREGTQKQYRTYLQKWTTFCSRRGSDTIQSSISEVLDFLTELFDGGLGYSGLNTARCALSSVILLDGNKTVGSHPLVNRFLKVVFNVRPCVPRYQYIWDTSLVLSYLKTFAPLDFLNLKDLTLKLVMLIALVIGQRSQSIYLMDLASMQKNVDHYKLLLVILLSNLHQAENSLSSFFWLLRKITEFVFTQFLQSILSTPFPIGVE